MKTVMMLTRRNIRLFFKDLGMLLTSLITPLILLLLYTTFLCNVFRDSFMLQILLVLRSNKLCLGLLIIIVIRVFFSICVPSNSLNVYATNIRKSTRFWVL